MDLFSVSRRQGCQRSQAKIRISDEYSYCPDDKATPNHPPDTQRIDVVLCPLFRIKIDSTLHDAPFLFLDRMNDVAPIIRPSRFVICFTHINSLATGLRGLQLVFLRLFLLAVTSSVVSAQTSISSVQRAALITAILEEDADRQIEQVKQLVDTGGDSFVVQGLEAWRQGSVFLYETNNTRTPFILDAQIDAKNQSVAISLRDGLPIKDSSGMAFKWVGADLTPVDTSSKLRKAIKTVLDLLLLASPDPRLRRDATIKLGQEQNIDYLPHFENRLAKEPRKEVQRALREALALTRTTAVEPEVQLAAVRELGELRSINSLQFLQRLDKDMRGNPAKFSQELREATHSSVLLIENYVRMGNLYGTAFRGISLAAVLVVAALGLAITFGLMNIINMAHGEIMAVGAYTAFVVQGIFGNGLVFSLFGRTVSIKGMGLAGSAFDIYFIVALAASFVTAGLVGLALERGIIRFLYKRPLESLLATWGVSLIMQQIFRHTFGSANVQVNAPTFLSGSYVVHDVLFAYNRLFIVVFAFFVVFLTWLLLTKTSLGLQIRAVMQNRSMAACIGVRTDRVNMMSFAFGSGLAGMAGVCLSQIANVGPSLGQSYIIDCFMVVVLGGVGNLVGTVSAAAGVGITDQILQPWLGAVLGKISVLVAIILFLQWRPNGLFVTRSRSLDG